MIVKRAMGMRTERQRVIGLDVGEGRALLFRTIISGTRFYTRTKEGDGLLASQVLGPILPG